MFAQSLTQGSGLFELGGKCGAGSDLATDHNRMSRIELAIQIRMDQLRVVIGDAGAVVGHASFVLRAPMMRRRARARRDITVPTGSVVTSAISRYSSP